MNIRDKNASSQINAPFAHTSTEITTFNDSNQYLITSGRSQVFSKLYCTMLYEEYIGLLERY